MNRIKSLLVKPTLSAWLEAITLEYLLITDRSLNLTNEVVMHVLHPAWESTADPVEVAKRIAEKLGIETYQG